MSLRMSVQLLLLIASNWMAGSLCAQERRHVRKESVGSGLRAIPIREVPFKTVRKTKLKFALQNETKESIQYMQGLGGPLSCASLELSLNKDGKMLSPMSTSEGAYFHKSNVRILKPNAALSGVLDLGNYKQLEPGRYEVRAKYDVKKTYGIVKTYDLTPVYFERIIMILHIVEALPKELEQRQRLRIKRVLFIDKKGMTAGHYFIGIDVGLGPVREKKATLFFVVRESKTGKTKLKESPRSVLRPFRVDPKAKITTMLYNPFPNSDHPIVDVHVLVSEPRGSQHYLVVDLSNFSVRVKKKQTLKPGKRYKLHKKKLGPVELVPADGK